MKRLVTAVLAAGMVWCAGCLAPRTAGVSVEQGELRVEDRALASRLQLVQDQTVRIWDDAGFLKVQVTMRHTGKRNTRVQYRFVWKDRDGMVLKGADTLWTVLPLHGGEEAVVEAICPVPGAADFRLVVRPADCP